MAPEWRGVSVASLHSRVGVTSLHPGFAKTPSFLIGESGKWELATSLIYFSRIIDNQIEVPAGFVTDLASIPVFFKRVIGTNGNHRLAAVIHDYIYSKKGNIEWLPAITRKTADEIFFEAMKLADVPAWQRHAMYRAVRMAGWAFWK